MISQGIQQRNNCYESRSMRFYGVLEMKNWSGKRDSNSRPRPWQGRALPTELFPLILLSNGCCPKHDCWMVLPYGHQIWSGKRDSNSRPRPWQGRALPTELFPLILFSNAYCPKHDIWMVLPFGFQILERETRLELATPTLARSCSTN